MRVVRVVLILASFLGFLIACGIALDSRIALGVAGLLALNLVYLFLVPKPWFGAKEKQLRDQSKSG